jgi:hypothetical protein
MIAPTAPVGPFPWKEADAMLTLLINRAAQLSRCRAGSPDDEEFDCLANAIEAYDAKRWPASPRSSGASRLR